MPFFLNVKCLFHPKDYKVNMFFVLWVCSCTTVAKWQQDFFCYCYNCSYLVIMAKNCNLKKKMLSAIKKLFSCLYFKCHRYEECFKTTSNYFKLIAFQTWQVGRWRLIWLIMRNFKFYIYHLSLYLDIDYNQVDICIARNI